MEDKKFIIGLLTTNAEEFVRFVESRSQEKFTESLNGKWSVGQNVDHLIRSLSPVNLALALPAFVLRIALGKPNRPPRTYQQLVDRYPNSIYAKDSLARPGGAHLLADWFRLLGSIAIGWSIREVCSSFFMAMLRFQVV